MTQPPKKAPPAKPDPTAERKYKMLAVGAVTDRLTRPILGKHGLAEGNLLAHWEAIVGPAVAALALPERVRFPKGRRDGGELTVRVSSGPVAVQIQHDVPRILERVNSYYGFPAVVRLKIVQAPLPVRRPRRPPDPPPLAPAEAKAVADIVAPIVPDELRAALERLGQAVARRRKT
ncbi:MAG: DciA family protein [Rhodospirillaceae bacterium]